MTKSADFSKEYSKSISLFQEGIRFPFYFFDLTVFIINKLTAP